MTITRKKSKRLSSLQRAKRLAKRFHGTAAGHVVELSARERRKPGKYAVVVGDLDSLRYAPRAGSKRAGTLWEHASGDKGSGRKSPNRPLLVIDPITKRPIIVAHKSPMRFSSKRGLVG